MVQQVWRLYDDLRIAVRVVMNAPTFHPDHDAAPLDYSAAPLPNFGHKLRPASHTFYRAEGGVLWTLVILGMSALLVVTTLWLIRLLG